MKSNLDRQLANRVCDTLLVDEHFYTVFLIIARLLVKVALHLWTMLSLDRHLRLWWLTIEIAKALRLCFHFFLFFSPTRLRFNELVHKTMSKTRGQNSFHFVIFVSITVI